ncbi:D(1A) dopamine receptor isoform X1 [Nematostella vectensis]|uniref:D(1A) dopamine receptor isoform X1 n=2 Tax=Nematostella vectensis TaxID=45351 RepID=UPI0020778DBB|nr:D(1A) dopamine receptor isoform X1 [Nematostella vectensis]
MVNILERLTNVTNSTEMPFGRHCVHSTPPYELSCITAAITAFLALMTLPGNLLIIVAIFKDPFKELKTPFNYFVLNLAVSDLVAALVIEPNFIAYHVLEMNGRPNESYIGILHVSYFICCMASFQSIAALSRERYLSVRSRQRRQLSQKRTFIITIAIWVTSLTFPFIYFATSFYKFSLVFANIFILGTLGIIAFAYVRIYQRLHARVANTVREGTRRETRQLARNRAYERKATRAFFYIAVVFVACNIPSCIATYLANFCDLCSCNFIHVVRDAQFLLTLTSCTANQFLYSLRMPTFKRALKSIMGCAVRDAKVASTSGQTQSQSNTEPKIKAADGNMALSSREEPWCISIS